MSSHIEYLRFSKGEGCTEEGCRARKFYIEDGKKFCQRGHEQSGFTQTQQDEDDWNTQGRKTRKAREEMEHVERVFSGQEAADLYLQCYQLILWKQCHWLINAKKFPKELETIVRDLWGLRVKIMMKERKAKSGYGSSTVGFSSTEGETEDSERTETTSLASRKRARRKARAKERLPGLVESLAWCYLGMLLLRLPTSLGEVYRWATTGEMIFNRAIQAIPQAMKLHLPSHFHAALENHSMLKGSDLHGAVLEHVEFYNMHHEIVFPALNSPLLIFKHVRDLALPVEIYPAVRRLATLLEINFTYPILHKRNYGVTAYPEIQLISLLVIATKLSQPFDTITRHPESASDPTTLKISWARWRQIMADDEGSEGLKRGQQVMVKDKDVFEMKGKELDDYLDWYQRTWIDDRDPKMAEQVLDLFPLPDISPQELTNEIAAIEKAEERLKKVQNSLLIQKAIPIKEDEDEDEEYGQRSAKDAKRPGELYKRYRSIEELPADAKAFYERAAENAGISLHMLVKGVFQTELQLESWNLAERKRKLVEERKKGLEEGDV